ncbi:MAG: hypothetical protein IJB83_03180 [Bacilli bacterium]|nr:hypothetical protein [Bacilli bacterium]
MIKFEPIKDAFMIISIVKILNYYEITYARENPINESVYHGLLIDSFKTEDDTLFSNFKKYGKWLERKDEEYYVLLYLFDKQRKINKKNSIIRQ